MKSKKTTVTLRLKILVVSCNPVNFEFILTSNGANVGSFKMVGLNHFQS